MNLAHSDSPSTRTLELSIVVVHYRSWPDTRALAAALVGQIDPGRHEILVVDNSPDEPPPAEGAGPGTRLLSPGRNLGFAGAAAVFLGGAAVARWAIGYANRSATTTTKMRVLWEAGCIKFVGVA